MSTADLTSKAVFTTDNPRVATVDTHGFVHPTGDGLATITATVDGQGRPGIDLGRETSIVTSPGTSGTTWSRS